MPTRTTREPNCGVEATINVIGGRWKSWILWTLRDEALRFLELQGRMPGISNRMLTRQLRELGEDGIVERRVYAEAVPHTDYRLTARGAGLRPILDAMHDWGVENTAFTKEPRV